MNAENTVIQFKRKHQQTWRDKPDWSWFAGLIGEVWELALSLIGLHKHPPEVELRQISAIAMNWLEKRMDGKDECISKKYPL
jgi:hypothetical protein